MKTYAKGTHTPTHRKKKKQQNFINKQIKLQKFCPQLARLFEAGQLRAKYKK